MAKNQGFNRLTEGFSKKLTKSEISRGYLFISKDRKVLKLKELSVIANKEKLGKMKLDSYGRLGIGKAVIGKIGQSACHFKLEDNILHLKF